MTERKTRRKKIVYKNYIELDRDEQRLNEMTEIKKKRRNIFSTCTYTYMYHILYANYD